MFHIRNYFHFSTTLHRQPFIHKIINHHPPSTLFSACATTVSKTSFGCENQFAHRVLEANPRCRVLRGEHNRHTDAVSVEIDWDQNWKDLTTSGIVECLEKVGIFCKGNGRTMSDEIFDKFVDACTERCFDFTDDQLIQSLQILTRHPLTESPRSRNFVELWNAFDDACVDRISTWDYNQILFVCDHWHMLHLGKFNKFNHHGSLKVGQEIRKLPPHQLVQLTFYLNLRRVQILDMFEIESKFVKSMDEFSLNEIAVVCMGLFKTQTTLKIPESVEKICKRLIREIDTVEYMALTCILKELRHSCNIYQITLVREVLDAVSGQLPRLSTLTCLHVALLGTHLHICHQSCIEQILHRFFNDVKSLRLKDFERISYVIGSFDFQSESKIENRLCQQFLVELRNRRDDIIKYPQSFVLCVHYLTMKGYHDEEMISAVLDPSFLDRAYGSQVNYGNELFSIDAYAKINLKETYTGNELTETNRRHMGKSLTDCTPERNATDKILMELKRTSDELCTHSYLAHVLPHFTRPDIVIAYDKKSGTGIDISHNLRSHYVGTIIDRSMLVEGLDIDATDVEILNIIVGGWNNYVRDTPKLNGFMRQKIEQSKILGLRPVLIPVTEWTRLQESDRKHYVKYKIKTEQRSK